MTDYESLPELREALTSDDPDRRAAAYGSVIGADMEVRDVLSGDPSNEAIQGLVDAGVIPERESPSQLPPQSAQWEQVIGLLEEIRDNTGGGA